MLYPLKMLDFQRILWYNILMKNKAFTQEELNHIPKNALVQMYLQLASSFELISNQLETLQKQNQSLVKTMDSLQEKVDLLTQARFGRKTEKLSEITADQIAMDLSGMLDIFNEIEALTENSTPLEPEMETITYKRKKQKGKRDEDIRGVEVIVEPAIELSEAELKELFPYGYKRLDDEVYRDLEYIPAVFKVHEHHIAVYAGKRDTGIVKANRPERLLKNSLLTPSLAAGVMDLKYVQHLPLNRISEDFKRKDVNLSRQVMAGWMITITDRFLRPVYRELHRKLLTAKLVHCDETPFTLIHNGKSPNSRSYMWVYHTGPGYGCPPVYVYQYQGGRNQDIPREFLKDFKGFLLTDGYQAYHAISNERPDELKVAGCWAHARRPFADIVKSAGKTASQGTVAAEAVKRIAAIYHVDNMMKDASAEERFKHRQQSVKPLVDSYFAWAKSVQDKPNDASAAMIKGINYSLNQERYLRMFLEDGMIPLDNNAAERSVKNFCVGKHSWHVIDSKNGAEASAILYSIAETAKADGLKTYEYFKFLLEQILLHQDDAPADYIDDLVPWSDKLPDSCRKIK